MAEEAVLGFLEKNEEISDSGKFAEEQGINHDDIVNVIKSLNGFRLVDAEDIKRERWVLTDEGKKYAESGSPEVQLFLAIPAEGITIEELQKKLDPSVFKIGCQQAIKNKWVEIGKSQVSGKVKHVEDRLKDLLLQIQNGETVSSEDIDGLKIRKLITQQVWKVYSVRKGPKYAPQTMMCMQWPLLVIGVCFAVISGFSAILRAAHITGPLPLKFQMLYMALIISFTSVLVSIYLRSDYRRASDVLLHVGAFLGATTLVGALVINLNTPLMVVSLAIFFSGMFIVMIFCVCKPTT